MKMLHRTNPNLQDKPCSKRCQRDDATHDLKGRRNKHSFAGDRPKQSKGEEVTLGEMYSDVGMMSLEASLRLNQLSYAIAEIVPGLPRTYLLKVIH